jgi:hypothetical protein
MSSRNPLPIDLLVPVIDGDNPADWVVWGKPLEEHLSDFYTTARYIPTDYKDLGGVRLRVLLHSEQTLHQRNHSEWKGVIGTLVDANGDSQERDKAAERVIRVCSALAASDGAWYRKLRFHLALLVDEDPPANKVQTYIDFGHQLKLRAESVLATDVQWQLVSDSRTFRSTLKTFEQQLVYVYLRHRAAAA